ncbi:MAG: Na/Pi cotransporter family protein [Planctomycetes bacterium]|nr:Na/Pi cotransporter family protein [Planctomycetota bacterium]
MLALLASAAADPAWGKLFMGLLGGLALFLFGMDLMASSLKLVAGERMKEVLAKLTKNRFMGVFSGAFVTSVIQSSSVTTVLVVGFVSAGLMSLTQTVGVIMGANIGTTVTAQIVAFHATSYALLFVSVGFVAFSFSKNKRFIHWGRGIFGLGLIFLGMQVMGDSMLPLRDWPPFLEWMTRMERPALGLLAGAVFTALVQSSSATTGVVIMLASGEFINLEAGIAMCLGANVGTCVTAFFATFGGPRIALRAAMIHILFNLVGVLFWLPFITVLGSMAREVSLGTGDGIPREIANAHTLFNLINAAVLIWFAPLFVVVVEKLFPDRPVSEDSVVRPKYLDRSLIDTPSLALDRVRLELLHMGNRVEDMYKASLRALLDGTQAQLFRLRSTDEAVDTLHGAVVEYLGLVSQESLSADQTEELMRLLEAANALENIGDVIETSMVNMGLERLDVGLQVSPQTREVIGAYHVTVGKALSAAVVAVIQKNPVQAGYVLGMKEEIKGQLKQASLHEVQRLVAEEPGRLSAYRIEMDTLGSLRRIYDYCRRMARASMPVADRPSTTG